MVTMILISSVAMLVGIVGSFVIWRFDALRAEEIAHTPPLLPVTPPALAGGGAEAPNALDAPR